MTSDTMVVREAGLRGIEGGSFVPTGLDLRTLTALRERVAQGREGEPLRGAIRCAGLPQTPGPVAA